MPHLLAPYPEPVDLPPTLPYWRRRTMALSSVHARCARHRGCTSWRDTSPRGVREETPCLCFRQAFCPWEEKTLWAASDAHPESEVSSPTRRSPRLGQSR